ncbi:MAG: hypothetical protein M1832_004847 [Thelocarpon impressellum]|nr:MAG: hypothetical protein M1832_004847 [Thelocarpon impressellum]
MSATATPITPAAFTSAIQDLPLPNLHLKAAELRNSMAHLQYSNLQLEPYAEEDRDCADAIRENEEVMARMEERIRLLREEVERRGFRWGEAEIEDRQEKDGETTESADGAEGMNGIRAGTLSAAENGDGEERGPGLTDEELRRRLRERMEEDMMGDGDGDGDGDGMHL